MEERFALKRNRIPAPSFESDENIAAFVQKCDEDFDIRFHMTANEIMKNKDHRIITLSGPTCSGKTTAAERLISELVSFGNKVFVVSIDDFYLDKDILHKQSLDGEIDYDSVKTIDMMALSSFVSGVFDGGELMCPIFDFRHGRRTGYRKIERGSGEVFIFEGIQAVYPEVTALLGKNVCSVYISPQSCVEDGGQSFSPNEIRLMRRIVRDKKFRNTSAEFTMRIWNSVRRNEEENIFPNAERCKFLIDSSFDYEAGMLKPYLVEALKDIPVGSAHRKSADNILSKLSGIREISSEHLSPKSLYREFI